jgi:hypothetical protein
MSQQRILHSLAIVSLLIVPVFAAPKVTITKPDFTKGDPIPAGATHDWNLGATGLRGWMFSDKLETSDARQVRITKVEKGSPADGKLEVGDVILGVGGKPFSYDPRTEFGKALTAAEAADGKLSLTRWKNGNTDEVVLQLQVFGAYSKTAPFDCKKSAKVFQAGCDALAKRMQEDSKYANQGAIPRSLNALALLSSGDPKYMDLIKREVKWAQDFSADSMATWYYGYVMMFLAEYTLATGDTSALPGLRRLAMEASKGQSNVGSWGHKFATPDGRLYGYGMMNAPGVPLTTALVLAEKAGIKEPEVKLAIERSMKLIRFFDGKGSVPYGDHNPWIQTHDDNGKNGMSAVLFNLANEAGPAEYFSRMSLASHGSERDTGHTGNFWNMTWAMPGVAPSGPNATGAWMQEFGSWYYDLARSHNGAFPHQGPPSATPDHTRGWDATGSFLLAYAMPLKKIYLTGKQPSKVPQLSNKEAESIIIDGRGWTNKNRFETYDKFSDAELLERLGSWSPTVRDRAGIALARRKGTAPPIDAIVALLDSEKIHARYGACQALIQLKAAAAPAIPALLKTLKHEDLWLRILAAEAISQMGASAKDALPEMLTMLAKGESPKDPRGMEQRYLSYFIFGGMLKSISLNEIDQNLLQKAITAGLQNQDGRARGSISNVYDKLSYEQLKPLLPAIHEAIVKPAPSGEMFAGQVRVAGIKLFAKHKIAEGLPLCIPTMDIQSWGKQDRINGILGAIEIYGAGAKTLLPELKKLEADLSSHGEAKNLKEIIDRVKSITQKIEATTETVELRSMK